MLRPTDFLLLLLALFPIATYCVILAALNRREQPALASGSWDFLGLMFGASGVLLVVLPFLLSEIFKELLNEQLRAEPKPSGEALGGLVLAQWLTWGIWWALVVGGTLLLVWWRRSKTVVYNVSPDDFEHAFAQALARLNLTGTRKGVRILITPAQHLEALPESSEAITAVPDLAVVPAAPALQVLPPSGEAVVDVELFPMLYNVTLHWRDTSEDLRQAIELELARELREVRTDENPVSAWFLGVAGFLFALMFLVVMVLLFGSKQPHR